MKKKISSFITAMFVLLVCVLASACGDKYKNMEFKIYYAYSEDSDVWHDGTKGISINYNLDGEVGSSLVFDEFGSAKLYLKVEVKNVKSKHLGAITVSSTSTSGLNFSSLRVSEGEVFEVSVDGVVNGKFKFYENASGRTHQTDVQIYRELEAISIDQNFKPAMKGSSGSTLNLLGLSNHLIYQPINETNQIGVTYSIDSIGYFIQSGYTPYIQAGDVDTYLAIENDTLKIKNSFLSSTTYVVRLKATSIYHNEDEPISTFVHVYVVESSISEPEVLFDDDTVLPEKDAQINIYQNGKLSVDYSQSTIKVNKDSVASIYKGGVDSQNGILKLASSIYVMNSNGVFEKYNFNSENSSVGINGLFVKKEAEDIYTFSIASRDVKENKIKVVYSVDGLNFAYSEEMISEKEITVIKGVLPKNIVVNDVVTLTDGDEVEAKIYSTSNKDVNYKGLKLKLAANPTEDPSQKISLSYEPDYLKITNSKNANVGTSISQNETIYVNFNSSNATEATLTIKVLKVPAYYNGKDIEDEDNEYITVAYKIKKVVTADSFNLVADSNGTELAKDYINAQADDYIYLKVNYTGSDLDTSTIVVKSSNEAIKFNINGVKSSEIMLNANVITEVKHASDYNIYAIPIAKSNKNAKATITAIAGEGELNISNSFEIESVFVTAEDEAFTISAKNDYVRTFALNEIDGAVAGNFYFAVEERKNIQFAVKDSNGGINTISKIIPTNITKSGEGFNSLALDDITIVGNELHAYADDAGTQAIKLHVNHYYIDNTIIKPITSTIYLQVAVVEPIAKIDKTITNETIGYINAFYEEISSTRITYKALNSSLLPPNSTVKFVKNAGDDASEEVVKNNACSINILIDERTNLTESGVDFDIKDNKLNGVIDIKLNRAIENIDEIVVTLQATVFEIKSQTLSRIVIKIAEVDKASSIDVALGENDHEEYDDGTQELLLSFINTSDGGSIESKFNVTLNFETIETPAGAIRFDDNSKALTYILYRYDEDGIERKINNNFFSLSFNDDEATLRDEVTLRAEKDLGGGYFKLVFATKDSFDPQEGHNTINYDKDDFNTVCSINIRLSDGVTEEFLIRSIDDLKNINYHMDKKFALAADLGVGEEGVVEIDPIGREGSGIVAFTGSLSGKKTTNLNSERIENTYSIKMKVGKLADSVSYGNVAGLFAVLGKNAKIEDLTINAAFTTTISSTDSKGLKVGVLAGVADKNSSINNVKINLLNTSLGISSASNTIDFGGIVGVNEGTITNSRVVSVAPITISSAATQTHNIGLIAGTNNGTIAGAYKGKDSLKNFVYDVVADLTIGNNISDGEAAAIYNIGGVVGSNTNTVSNVLIGGKITVNSSDHFKNSYLGGIVGNSNGNGNKILLSTAMSLNVVSEATNVDVGGIAGSANATETNGTEINTVKFVSATTKINGTDILGQVSGLANVAGIVASATNGLITNSSIESFVRTYIPVGETVEQMYPTISGGTITAGLVAEISGTSVSYSFVNANIKSSGTIILTTTNDSESNTYFIGNVAGTVSKNKTTYSVVNGNVFVGADEKTISFATYFTPATVTAETTDFTNIYTINEDGTYEQATKYVAGVDYWLFNESAVDDLFGITSNSNWEIKPNYNMVQIGSDFLFFPYLLKDSKPLQIVEPKSISADINEDYVTEIDSVYVEQFDYSAYHISESVVVNFLKGATHQANTHNLFNSNELDPNGLFDLSLLPEDAQGGYAYEILGDGYRYAYINDSNQIVFTAASGNKPIIIQIYSVFNTKVCVYVAVYSQSLVSELTLNSNSVYKVDNTEYDYEMNLYTGQNNKVISLGGKNLYNGQSLDSIFKVDELSRFLSVGYTSDKTIEDLLVLNVSNLNAITLKIADGKKITDEEKEVILTFSLYINKEYFSNYIEAGAGNIKVADVKLKVNLYNSATAIDVIGSDSEITSKDDINFKVNLTTDYRDDALYSTTKNEKVSINANGEAYVDLGDKLGTSDYIRISFNITEGSAEANKLKENVNRYLLSQSNPKPTITHFAELFDITILTSLYKTSAPEKTIGYTYNIFIELKDNHYYRYIEDNIKFDIVVYAENTAINNEDSPLEILIKPTNITTARIENYAVESVNFYNDYAHIVTNDNLETSIVEPGSRGNVMMIYLEPSYSQVSYASIKSSSLMVPSLGKNVQLKFTQLAYDRRNELNAFTTLTGVDAHTQQGDTLELSLISEIDASGNRIYNGIVLVYIQLERFTGLEATMTVELNVKTKANPEGITRTRSLLTTYLPDVAVSYNNDRLVQPGNSLPNGYLIQKGTSQNIVSIRISGYQFNSNPSVVFNWLNKDSTNKTYNYLNYYFLNDYDEVEYDSATDSYTLKMRLKVAEDIEEAFTVYVTLSLTTKDGQIKTDTKSLTFYPTDYIINSINVTDLTESGSKNIAIGKNKELGFNFVTDNAVNDLSERIYQDLFEGYSTKEELAQLFTYYKNGRVLSFADTHLITEFEFNLVNDEIISIIGLEKFKNVINFGVNYHYDFDKTTGFATLKFGTGAKYLDCQFTLNIYPIDAESEVLVHSADDIYNSTTGTWELYEGANYVLMNDIELENVTPITTKIGRFDGNNRVISIKSFMVDNTQDSFGLFANIGTYEVVDSKTEEVSVKQTILKNMIVNYGNFTGSIALNNCTNTNITFGGLVAKNNGGLIYNCDVINLNPSKDVVLDIIVASNANVVFGGLVGENTGIITNSRIGRDSYTKIIATKTTESTSTVHAKKGLTFEIFNKKDSLLEGANQFGITTGGFVGVNNGTISSSFATKTNIVNYSTNESINYTAGFVGVNNEAGTISYSYAKANEATITSENPYSTGYGVDHKGNGIIAGFVYNNMGNINNAYANLELVTKSSYIAGFVYNNGKTVSESYAASTMNTGSIETYAMQPFIGVDPDGNLLTENGTLENTYYLMRSDFDDEYIDGNLDYAQGLNEENFQISEYLVGFAFVLSNNKNEREQGIWSYYNINNERRILPELMNANKIAYSYRYEVTNDKNESILVNTVSYAEGTINNPHTISNVKEFNDVFTEYGQEKNLIGHVRLINNINFNDDFTAISTRTDYILGSLTSSTRTSVEGNGLSINGIYLDVENAVVTNIGLFAEIQNAYVKNLNLNFATPTTDGQFSTQQAMYSGGLAGQIKDSAIINIKLNAENTTLVGKNFVGGVAGLISGSSLVYGIETNLNVKATCTEDYLYYNENEYRALNIIDKVYYDYNEYLKHLSYAGGVAGVLDLTKRTGVEYNVEFVDIRGDKMPEKTFDGKPEANIIGQYAGGVAGYAGAKVDAFKLRYFIGETDSVQGNMAVGAIYGVSLGRLVASQASASKLVETEDGFEEEQFAIDTAFGDYVTDLYNDKLDAAINSEKTRNNRLLNSNNYAGGLIGVGINATVNASYSKATINSGRIIGGIMGVSVASGISYSYAIPYVNVTEDVEKVGGLIGSAYAIMDSSPERNGAVLDYDELAKYYAAQNQVFTDIQFTYSTLIVDNNKISGLESEELTTLKNVVLDYVVADYSDNNDSYIKTSNSPTLMSVYVGTIKYGTDSAIAVNNNTKAEGSLVMELHKFYKVGDSEQIVAFQEVFSSWAIIKFWNLNSNKYFPLLSNKTVENYIIIDDDTDIQLIRNNLEGNFMIVNNINIDAKDLGNWVVEGLFKGVLIGKIEKEDRRPVVTITGLTANANDSTGFFQSTLGATINNITFAWNDDSDPGGAIDISGTNVTTVAGVVCDAKDTLISSVEVVVSGEGYLINDATNTILGFGGIVGEAYGCNIMACNYAGKLQATTLNSNREIHIGGIVGKAESYTDFETGETKDSVITGCRTGAVKESDPDVLEDISYPTTKFNLTLNTEKQVYIGGTAGKSEDTAIASINVGGVNNTSRDYQDIIFNITLVQFNNNLMMGGVVGHMDEGMFETNNASTIFNIDGSDNGTGGTTSYQIEVGGLVGEYSSSYPIAKSNTRSNINTEGLSLDSLTLFASTGVGTLNGNASMKSCLFTGEINTEKATKILNIYAGGAVASVISAGGLVKLQEVTTNTIIYAGHTETSTLYAGGLVAHANKVEITYSNSLGRIVPITSKDAIYIYVGGLIGSISQTTTEESEEDKGGTNSEIYVSINNSYTISSIVADSVADASIANLNIGALVGSVGTEKLVDASNNAIPQFANVFYSTDYALATEKKYDGTTNISAATLNGSVWHKELQTEDGVQNGIWKTFTRPNGEKGLPYLSSLEEVMKAYAVLTKPTGETQYDYVSGSAMRPIEINSSANFEFNSYEIDEITELEKTYTYYLLRLGTDRTIPTFTRVLNGMLLCEDKTFDVTSDKLSTTGAIQDINIASAKGIVSGLTKHSVISNLHVKISDVKKSDNVTDEFDISASVNTGIIAGDNNGVIFNCSVQGNNISVKRSVTGSVTGSGSLGLIAGTNKGLVSYSYSTAEIISSSVNVSGIVYHNESKMLSNYFTGYINPLNGNYAAGIVYSVGDSDNEGYLFNNYMAGVITGIKTETNGTRTRNAFYGSPSIVGSNNFIDKYSDIELTNDTSDGGVNPTVLAVVSTSELMSNTVLENGNKLLSGYWHTTGSYNNTSKNVSISTSSHTFGYNYNYPVHQFNKMISSGNELIAPDDTKHQLYTGNGIFESVWIEDGETKKQISNIEDRYSVLTHNTSAFESENSVEEKYGYFYNNAMKIPHLGVLSSVHALCGSDNSLNYVIIYDIDGSNNAWTAVGTKTQDEKVNGFAYTSGFKGVLISNKYYQYNAPTASDPAIKYHCTIENLSTNGLVAIGDDSYIADMVLGSFSGLKNSGALGTTVAGTTTVTNISFKYLEDASGKITEISTISGYFSADVSENVYGGLFGIVSSTLNVKNVITSAQATTKQVSVVELSSTQASAGLIAGKLDGSSATINIEEITKDTGTGAKVSLGLYVTFNGNSYAGGIVGKLNGGTITTNNRQVVINTTTNNFTSYLGGIAGHGFGTIDSANVSLVGSITANAFGGVICEANGGSTKVTNTEKGVIIKIEDNKEFNGSADIDRYYGLIAGLQSSGADITVSKLDLSGVKQLKVTTAITGDTLYNTNSETTGVGALVGANKGATLTVDAITTSSSATLGTEPDTTTGLKVYVEGVPNVGGYIGYATDSIVLDVNNKIDNLVVSGQTNVGGLFGYLDGNVSDNMCVCGDEKFLTLGSFATININPMPEGFTIENVGGLFGKWVGSNLKSNISSSSSTSTESTASAYIAITNANNITGVKSTHSGNVKNVGGIAGSFSPTSNVGNLKNLGSITCVNYTNSTNIKEIDDARFSADKKIEAYTTKFLNVGGIFGSVILSESVSATEGEPDSGETPGSGEISAENNITISNIFNADIFNEDNNINININGYQNVGGLIGYISGKVTIENKASFNLPEDALTHTFIVNDDSTITYSDADDTANPKKPATAVTLETPTVGNIQGVINVGGAVGYAEKDSTIQYVYSTAKVYGNVNVGGLVGANIGATLNTNVVGDITSTTEVVVKGIYYNHKYVNEAKTEVVDSYIPTSVGGLVGFTTSTSNCGNSIAKNNIVNGVEITSTNEGANDRSSIKAATDNFVAQYLTDPNFSELQEMSSTAKLQDIKTGFGGFYGTVDASTLINGETSENIIAEMSTIFPLLTNNIVNIEINAELGVNVGTVYGYYNHNEIIGLTGFNILTITPKIYGNISVNGAYNIGGVVGFVGGTAGGHNFKNEDLVGNATINLQDKMTGMYVGGLFGKTDDAISDLTLSTGTNVNIIIHTDHSYYVGGLIGRAEVGDGATLTNLNLGTWTKGNQGNTDTGDNDTKLETTSELEGVTKWQITSELSDDVIAGGNDNAHNFGALIGMLKVVGVNSNGVSVKVQGNHKYPFTINTIENSNYYEGTSTFNSEETDGVVRLYAQAYYINKDSFTVSASKDASLHGSNVKNPLSGASTGWAKDYTMFKAIQRCIPQTENNGAEWDSIGFVYDANNIVNVVVDGNTDTIESTIYEEAPGVPKLYKANGIYVPMLDSNGEYMTLSAINDASNGLRETFEASDYAPSDWTQVEKDVYNALISKGYAYYDQDHLNQEPGTGTTYYKPFRKSMYKQLRAGSGEYIATDNKYNNSQIVFTLEAKYNDNSLSQSGSIFAVTGKITPTVTNKDKDDGKLEWWEILIIVVISIVVAYFTCGGGLAGLFGFLTGKLGILLIAGGTIVICKLQEHFVSQTAMQINFFQTYNQSAGYLSSMYSQEIYYENDKVKAKTDGIYMCENGIYQPYSHDRPSDFNTSRYLIKKIDSNNLSISAAGNELTLVGGQIQYAAGAGNNQLTLGEVIDKYEKITAKYTLNGKYTNINIYKKKNEPDGEYEYFIMNEKYIYHEGMYWINTTEMQTRDVQSTQFAPTINTYGDMSTYKPNNQELYVYGAWDGDQYTLLDGNKDPYNNYLTGGPGSYKIDYGNDNIFTLSYDKAVQSVEKDFYISENKLPIADSDGYTLMTGAYYTLRNLPNGTAKYATFKIQANQPIGDAYKPEFEGITWFMGDALRQNDEGGYKADGDSIADGETVEAINRYEKCDAYYVLQNGLSSNGTNETFGVVGGTITKAVYASTFKNPYPTGFENMRDNETTYTTISSAKQDGSPTYKFKVDYFRYFGGYKVTSTGKDEDKTYKVLTKSDLKTYGMISVYESGYSTAEPKTLAEAINGNYYLDPKQGDSAQQYKVSDTYQLSLDCELSDLSSADIIKVYASDSSDAVQTTVAEAIKGGYYLDPKQQIKVSDIYKEENGRIYQQYVYAVALEYTLIKDDKDGDVGALARIDTFYPETPDSIVYGKYLNNSAIGLYTRYKYTQELNDTIKVWNDKQFEIYGDTQSGYPNGNRKTLLVEVVKVTLTGGNIYPITGDDATISAGTIKIASD